MSITHDFSDGNGDAKVLDGLRDSQLKSLAGAQNQAEYDQVVEGAQGASLVPLDAAVQQRDDWAAAGQYYWDKAYMAMSLRDYRLMRLVADQAQNADKAASLDGAVLGAIFGVASACADTKAIAQGRGLPKADVVAARKAVLAEVAKHDADQASAKAAQRAVENAAYAAKKAADKAAWDAAAASRKAAADKAAAEKLATQAAAAEKAAAAKATAKAETDEAVSKIMATASAGYSGALYMTQEQVWAVRSPRLRTEGALAYGQTHARIEIAEVYGCTVLRLLPDGNAKHDLTCAKALADGGIEVDGVIMCDDGSEIVI